MRERTIIRASAEPAGTCIPRVDVTVESVWTNEDGTVTWEYSFDAGFDPNSPAVLRVVNQGER